MGAAYEDPGKIGGQPEGIWYVLQGGSSGGVVFRFGYVGHDPLNGTGPGKFSTQGCTTDHWEATKKAGGGGMGLSPAGNSYV